MCGFTFRVTANPISIGKEATSPNAIAGKTGAESPSSRLVPRRSVRYMSHIANTQTTTPRTLSMLSAI